MIMRVPDDQFSFALVVLILVILIVSFFRRGSGRRIGHWIDRSMKKTQ